MILDPGTDGLRKEVGSLQVPDVVHARHNHALCMLERCHYFLRPLFGKRVLLPANHHQRWRLRCAGQQLRQVH